MSVTKPEPKAGDPCPQCGGEFLPYREPTADEREAFTNKENPIALPARVDTATAAQRAELGALAVCRECGYQTRIKDEPKSRTKKTAE